MSEAPHSETDTQLAPRRKFWPWVVASVAVVLFLFFTMVDFRQEQQSGLLDRIDAAGGVYTLDDTDGEEELPVPNQFESLVASDRVVQLELFQVDPQLFREAMTTCTSLKTLDFDLGNSADFDPEVAARMTKLESLSVYGNLPLEKVDYQFLAGCKHVKDLYLSGTLHTDDFWQFLPQMSSLTALQLMVESNIRGEGIPDLSRSSLRSIDIRADTTQPTFHGFASFMTAPRLSALRMDKFAIEDLETATGKGIPPLEVLQLSNANLNDDILPVILQFRTLKDLTLSQNRITGDSLEQLATLRLEYLDLSDNPLTAEACRGLSQFGALERLAIDETGIESDWLNCWADSPLSSNLESLRLSGNVIDDAAMEVLKSFAKLQDLSLDHSGFSNEAILNLADHESLLYIRVEENIPDELVKRFQERVRQRGAKYPEISIWKAEFY